MSVRLMGVIAPAYWEFYRAVTHPGSVPKVLDNRQARLAVGVWMVRGER